VNYSRVVVAIALLLAVVVLPSLGYGQGTGIGTPAFGSLQSGDFDSVNLQNLNVNLTIPIVNHPGRGLSFQHVLAYNSLIFSKVSGSSTSWGFSNGWALDRGAFITYQKIVPGICLQFQSMAETTGYTFTDPAGTPHPFSIRTFTTNNCGLTNVLSGYATDASGYFMDISSNPVVVRAPDGTKFAFTPTLGQLWQYPIVTDTNGNQILSSTDTNGNLNWSDTLGQIVLKTIFPNGAPPSETDYSRLAVDGTYQTIAQKNQAFNIKTNFGCTGISEFTSGSSGLSLVTEIDLPNSQKYVFSYEPTPGFPGFVTGRLQQVTLPTGGTITYQYTGANNGINCADGTFIGLTRTINDGTTNSVWNYSRVPGSQSAGVTTVTAPQLPYDTAANHSVLTFDALGRETSRQIYQGAVAGTPVETINTAWASNGTPASRTIILEDGSTQSQVETQYDSNAASGTKSTGNLLVVKEHDWGHGAPGAILRTTTLTYLPDAPYVALNIINKLKNKTITDASGAIKYQTDIKYDEAGFVNDTCVTGASQHDDTNYGCSFTTRGLPTSVITYSDAATPSGGVTKNFSYDSVGNLVKIKVNSILQKQLNFSATTQYAFPDSVVSGPASGPQLTTSATYHLTTGQIATATDENQQVTTYTYNDTGHLDRLTDVLRSDGTHFPIAYNDISLTVTSSIPVQGTDAIQKITAMDGLGRPVTNTTEDATNAVYSIVKTQYDPVGRPYMSSNPYTSSAQFSTTQQFDAVGRPTVTLLPDGAKTTVGYSANSVTITDPTGKQRKSHSNGLGQVIEVDEPGVLPASANDHATMQTDGNFVLYDPSNNALWSTGTAGSNASAIYMQDDANLVLYVFKWSAGVYVAPTGATIPYDSCRVSSSLFATQILASGACLESPSGRYMLLMQSDGNLFIYDRSAGQVTWTANTYGHPGGFASLQSDGNFVVYDVNGVGIWSSGTYGTFSERLDMSDDGRIIIYKSAWSSGTSTGNFSGTAIAHPSCDIGTGTGWTGVLGTGSCFVSPNGHFELLLQPDGNMVIYDRSVNPAQARWSTGTQLTALSPGVALTTNYTYGVLDNLLLVNQGSQTRSYAYDGMGRSTDVTTPEAGHINFQYNVFNQVSQQTDARGVKTNLGYDTLNRLHTIGYDVSVAPGVPATPGVTYNYGTSSAQNNNGRLQQILDGLGSETYTYDLLGRATQLQKVINGQTYNIGYGYNLAGGLTSLTYPSGHVVQQSFDAIGRLCQIAPQTTGCGTTTNPYASGYSYNTAFETTAVNFGNGVNAAFGYSPDRLQMTSVNYVKGTQTLFGLNYFYKQDSTNCPTGATVNNGQIQCISDLVDSGRNAAYIYDSLGRLSNASTKGSAGYPLWNLTFTYDRYGNRTAQNSSNVTIDPATNRVSTLPYDASGNMLNDGINALAYDAAGRMVSSTQSSTVSTYSYDCKNLRVQKVSGGNTTVYIFSGGKVLAEYVNGAAPAAPTREYIYSGSALLAKIEAGATNYSLADHLSTRMLTDANGVSLGQQGHFPFGDPWYDTLASNKWKFTTYERDSESQNDYAMARFYVNRNGRFTSPDPLSGSVGNPQSLNRYAYGANDPINSTDPTGQAVYAFERSYQGLYLGAAGMAASIGSGCNWDGIAASCGMVNSFLRSGGVVQCPGNICRDVGWIVDKQGMGHWMYQQFWAFAGGHSGYFTIGDGPGALFYSIPSAGRAAALSDDPHDPNDHHEYGSNVYKEGDVYSYTYREQGPECQPMADCAWTTPQDYNYRPAGTELVGDSHFHPDDTGGSFSDSQKGSAALGGDIAVYMSQAPPIYGFLATGNGRVLMFNPNLFGAWSNGGPSAVCVLADPSGQPNCR